MYIYIYIYIYICIYRERERYYGCCQGYLLVGECARQRMFGSIWVHIELSGPDFTSLTTDCPLTEVRPTITPHRDPCRGVLMRRGLSIRVWNTHLLFWGGLTRKIILVRMECPALCSGGRRPLIAGCLSLQRLGMDLPIIRLAGIKPQTSSSESRHPTNKAIGTITASPTLFCLLGVGWVFLVRMECPALCSGGFRLLIAGCWSLQRLGMNLPVTLPVWSNLGPPASESQSLATELSVPRRPPQRFCFPLSQVVEDSSIVLGPHAKTKATMTLVTFLLLWFVVFSCCVCFVYYCCVYNDTSHYCRKESLLIWPGLSAIRQLALTYPSRLP